MEQETHVFEESKAKDPTYVQGLLSELRQSRNLRLFNIRFAPKGFPFAGSIVFVADSGAIHEFKPGQKLTVIGYHKFKVS